MNTFTTVVWDWNGTLLDDLAVAFETINRVLTVNDYPPIPDLATYRANFCFPIIQYYRNVGFDFARTPFEVVAQQFMDWYHPAAVHCALQQGAVPTLQKLQQEGVTQVLLSASLQSHLELQLGRYPIRPYFDRLLGIGDIYAESKLQLARSFVERCGTPAERILFVGDSVHDYEVATGCGCRAVLFTGGHQPRSLLAATGSPVIDELEELPSFLTSWRPL